MDHHQFAFGCDGADTLAERASGTLLSAGRGFVTLKTGVAYGPAAVEVRGIESLPEDSEIAEWEVAEEVTVPFTAKPAVRTLDGEVALWVPDTHWQGSGLYRVRAYARGRDTHWDRQVTAPTENYLLLFAPARSSMMNFQRLKKTDIVWEGDQDLHPSSTTTSPGISTKRSGNVDIDWQEDDIDDSDLDCSECSVDARIQVAGPARGLDARIAPGRRVAVPGRQSPEPPREGDAERSATMASDETKRPRVLILRGEEVHQYAPWMPGPRWGERDL